MKPTKILMAAVLATSLAVAPAQAQAVPVEEDTNTDLLILGGLALAVIAIIIGTQMSSGGSFAFSSKDIKGTDGNPLPQSPSLANTTVLMDF